MRNNPWKTELKIARSQRKRLSAIAARLADMSCEWDGCSGWLETESERLHREVQKHLQNKRPGDWFRIADGGVVFPGKCRHFIPVNMPFAWAASATCGIMAMALEAVCLMTFRWFVAVLWRKQQKAPSNFSITRGPLYV